MSNDELLPGSEPPPVVEEAARSAQDPSEAVAPPAAPTRRRRTKPAGTDAATVPDPSVPETPTRATRSRRKAAPTGAEDSLPIPADAPAAPEGTPAPEKAAPRRRAVGRPKATPKTPVAETVETLSATEAVPVAEVVAEAPKETAPRTRSRRRATSAEDVPAVSPTPTAEAAIDATVAPPAETPTEAIAAPETAETPRPERRPTRGRRKTDSVDANPVAPVEAAVETPTPEAALETPVAAPEALETAPAPERSRRRRPARSNRTAEEPVAAVSAVPVKPAAALDPAASADDALAEGENARTRTRRRGGRGRRTRTGEELDAETTTPEVEAVAEPEPVIPEPVEIPIDRTVGSHLLSRNGLPEIFIDNIFYPPLLFFGNMEGPKNRQRVLSEVRRAAAAGIHLHSTLIELPCPLSDASHALDEIDDRLRAVLEADPDGFVMPRIVFVPARGWKREYPTDIATYADGTTGDPSLTSERFWQEAERALATLVGHLREFAWYRRIFGYHLERGEWFQPADQGFDRSIANRDAFRDWLRAHYRENLVSLRAAWYDGDVQFHTAEIPPLPTKANPQQAFFEARRERRIIDFYEFTSESTAQRLIGLAKAIKRAADHQALVSVCYGYTFEFGHGYSGHLALGMLEAASGIDLLCGPPSYRDRLPGGGASLPAPIDSPPLHGKLWLTEDDTKTFLAPAEQDPDDFNPRLLDRPSTEEALARIAGKTLAHGTGLGIMDLWGEGWFDDDTLWERIGNFARQYATFQRRREFPRVPEVVVLIDERSLLHVQRGEPFFRRLTNGLRETLQRAGISYGLYLQSDLLAERFPTDAKLYLFLTPYRLTAEQRGAIKEKLQNGDKTLAWLYAPGSCEERPTVGGILEEGTSGTVGMTLRPQEWNSEIGSRILDQRHPLTERLQSRDLGTRERLNPSYYVADETAKVLAEYQGSGLPSVAVKEWPAWKSVFIGEPVLPLDLLRGLCRYAGVHLWTPQGEDVVSVGSGWVTLHAVREGQRTLRLPDAMSLYDVTDSRLIADETREHRLFMKAGTTRTFCVGSQERFEAMAFPNYTVPGTDRTRIVQNSAPDRFDKPERTEKPERAERPEKTERQERPERPERPEPRPPREPRSFNLPPPPPLPLSASEEERRLEERRQAVETLRAIIAADPVEIEAVTLSAEVERASLDLTDAAPLPVATTVPGLEAILPGAEGEMMANGRRRRRRGGRGRGHRRLPDGTEVPLTEEEALAENALDDEAIREEEVTAEAVAETPTEVITEVVAIILTEIAAEVVAVAPPARPLTPLEALDATLRSYEATRDNFRPLEDAEPE